MTLAETHAGGGSETRSCAPASAPGPGPAKAPPRKRQPPASVKEQQIIMRLELSPLARLLAIHIMNCRGRKVGACTESVETMAERLNATPRTIERTLAELRRAGLLRTRRRRSGASARRTIQLPEE